jgi:hypothetical protein
MKKMKTTAIAIALAAGVGTPAFAQVKQDIITITLSGTQQTSVSDTTAQNAGTFSAGPKFYKDGPSKLTDQNIIQYIAFTKHGNTGFYAHSGSTPHLVLVQGELSGFFNITPDIGHSLALYSGGILDGEFDSSDSDSDTSLAFSSDSTFVALDNGRNMLLNPIDSSEYPIGNHEPWGQIYVQYVNSSGQLDCDNVTYYFAVSVEECFDCFYMNSFMSTATFSSKTGSQVGPPCCSVSSALVGKGVDKYYMTFSFDDTINNPYLDEASSCWAGDDGLVAFFPGDGVDPDTIDYSDQIVSHLGKNEPNIARFTMNGIMTYSWTLNFYSTTESTSPDFLGTGSYSASGYGFVGLFCNLYTGTATFSEKLVKAGACCTGDDWASSWYGIGAEYVAMDESPGYQSVYDSGLYATPVNTSVDLTYHENFNRGGYENQTLAGNFAPSAWPTSAILVEPWDTSAPNPF